MNDSPQIDFLRYQLRKKETSARAVPYVSFILTHAALVVFLILSFFIDRLLGPNTPDLAIKIVLAIGAVLLLAGEWIYSIITSRRWKKDIMLLFQLEEEQQYRDEQERLKQQEEMLAEERFRNRILQADLQRQRNLSTISAQQTSIKSVRPVKSLASFPPNSSEPQVPFFASQRPTPAPTHNRTPQSPYSQTYNRAPQLPFSSDVPGTPQMPFPPNKRDMS